MPGPHNLFTTPQQRRTLVAPSILSADFANLARDCAHALAPEGAAADLLHIDIMDGHFVPNLTMGPALLASLRDALNTTADHNAPAFFDVHLMVTDPAQYLEPFARAGAHHITFHIEPALNPRAGTGLAPLSEGYNPDQLIDRIHSLGMTAGIAINPDTPANTLDPYLDRIDLALVMSVNPGFSGQKFIDPVLDKTRWLRGRLRDDQRIEMDGGIGPANAQLVRDAGCDVLVAASAFFGVPPPDRAGVVRSLRGN